MSRTRRPPLVSVILPVFNGERYLSRAVASVRSQSYRRWELIVVDDGSTDGSAAIERRLARTHPGIKLVIRRRNGGLVRALNDGLAFSRGKYVARIDHDDEWTDRTKLARQVAYLELHPGTVLIGCGVRIVDDRGKPVRVPLVASTDAQVRRLILFRNPFIHPAVVFRRSVLAASGNYPPRPAYVEDYHLWLKMGLCGEMAGLPRIMVLVRELPRGLSRGHGWRQYWGCVRLVWMFRGRYPFGWLALFKNLTERVFGFLYRPFKPLWVRWAG